MPTIEAAALALSDSPSGFLRLRKVLAPITGYAVLLVDTPPALGFGLSSAVLAAGWAVMPTATTQQDIDALIDTLTAMDELAEDELTAATRLAIVPNSVHRDRPDEGGLQALRAAYGELVTAAIPHSAAIRRALNRHLPLAQTEPKTAAMVAYRALAARVASAIGGTPQEAPLHATAWSKAPSPRVVFLDCLAQALLHSDLVARSDTLSPSSPRRRRPQSAGGLPGRGGYSVAIPPSPAATNRRGSPTGPASWPPPRSALR